MMDSEIIWRLPAAIRAFGRNPLVRTTDRVESSVAIVLIVSSIVAAAVFGAVGTQVYDSRSKTYAAQAETMTTLSATTVEDSAMVVQPNRSVAMATIRWEFDGTEHTDRIASHTVAKAGEKITIWVDAHGDRVARPPTPARAVNEAVGVALSCWLAAIGLSALLLSELRRRLDRRRYADWDRDLENLVGNGPRRQT